MNDKTFIGYLLNRANLIGCLIMGVGVPIFAFIKSSNPWMSLCIFFFVLIVLFLISLFKMFKDLKEVTSTVEITRTELQRSRTEKEEWQKKFTDQSASYQQSIKEKNDLREVLSVVRSLIASETRTTEGRYIKGLLEKAYEYYSKEREKEDV